MKDINKPIGVKSLEPNQAPFIINPYAYSAFCAALFGCACDGDLTVSSDTDIDGIKKYGDVTVDAGQTLSFTSGAGNPGIMYVSGTLTVNGTFLARRMGGAGAAGNTAAGGAANSRAAGDAGIFGVAGSAGSSGGGGGAGGAGGTGAGASGGGGGAGGSSPGWGGGAPTSSGGEGYGSGSGGGGGSSPGSHHTNFNLSLIHI